MCEKKELMSALKELLNSNRVIKTKTKPIRYVIKTPELFD
jgi:hypothetical protein